MATTVVVGTQWGDEGKGKITDFLAQQSDVVARFQGKFLSTKMGEKDHLRMHL